ncbi:MAG: SulP family inorganic anion transporter [Rudaea sp.]
MQPATARARVWPLADVFAGLSIAGLLLPEGVAYAQLAGLPPQAGVIALVVGLACYGLIGRSAYAIVSATSSSAAVLAAATLALAPGDPAQRLALAAVLVICTGIFFVLAGCLRLGAMSNLIARPVLRGYAFGLAIVIAIRQWPHVAGIQVQPSNIAAFLLEILRGIDRWHVASVATGVAALLALFALERVRRVPGTLLVIVGGIAASTWLDAHGVALTGQIRLALALPAVVLPAQEQWPSIIELALALMFILYAESCSSIRTFALRHNEGVRPNRDLIALGVANLISGLLQGAPVGAGYSGTSANDAAGARSRLAGVSAAAIVLVLVLLFVRWIERIPEPVLAAIVIHAVSKSIRVSTFRPYFLWQRDRLVALAAVVAVLAFGVLDGLLVAIAFSLAMLLRSLANPRISELGRRGAHDFIGIAGSAEAQRVAGMLILRPEEPLFFANADPLFALAREAVLAAPEIGQVVLSLEESPDLDSTSLESLAEFAAWLAARGIGLRLARLKEDSRDALWRARLRELPASSLDYASVDDAAGAAMRDIEARADQTERATT